MVPICKEGIVVMGVCFDIRKGLAKFTIEVRLIPGFRQKGAFSALSRGASYTRMRLIPEYIR